MSVSAPPSKRESVTSLELFFDLVFVFAITQVTAFIAADPTWTGVIRGLALLGLVYWSWVAYSWLGTSTSIDVGATAAGTLAAMAAMFIMGVLLPSWFDGGTWAVVAVAAYVVVRAMHLVLFYLLGAGDSGLRRATLRLAGSAAAAAVLLLVGVFLGGTWQLVLVVLAVLIDPIGAFVGGGRGWYLSAGHFAERHGLIVIIALGESLIALGLAVAGEATTWSLLLTCLLGALLASLLYVFYFRRTAGLLEEALVERTGAAQARFGRDVYSYGHLGFIAGIVLLALGLKKVAGAVADDGLMAHLHGIAGPALLIGAIAVLGTAALVRRRSAAPVPASLWAGLVLAAVAGASAWFAPVIAVLVLLCAAFAVAVIPPQVDRRRKPALQ